MNLISFEDGGLTGVLWSSTIGAPSGGSVEVPESVLYQTPAVPEPTSLFLLGVGALFLVTASVKRAGRSKDRARRIDEAREARAGLPHPRVPTTTSARVTHSWRQRRWRSAPCDSSRA